MRRILALLFIVVFGFVFIAGISNSIDLIDYDNTAAANGVSQSYINKSVTGPNQEVTFGVTENAETGSANIVTSIIANYRSFDTLGEVTVLFAAALGVSLLFGSSTSFIKRGKSGFVLEKAAKVLFPIILITGIYIFTHGHLTPGGGFPGGSMIASAFLLLYMADENFQVQISGFKALEGFAGFAYVVIGFAGLYLTGYFLKNILPTGVVGELFSAGLIPIVYVLIGLKVGSELTGIITEFLKEEAA